MLVSFLILKRRQILEFKRAANSAYKGLKSVTAGFFAAAALNACINDRTQKHKSWNSFCRGQNITFVLSVSNSLMEFSYRISPRNDAMGKGVPDMHFLKYGS